ncbi:MAG: hypothetical protein KDB14_20700 [Planctomycetales bacterium]|nr:hypothetical protein [Planctomycetales bacterium]
MTRSTFLTSLGLFSAIMLTSCGNSPGTTLALQTVTTDLYSLQAPAAWTAEQPRNNLSPNARTLTCPAGFPGVAHTTKIMILPSDKTAEEIRERILGKAGSNTASSVVVDDIESQRVIQNEHDKFHSSTYEVLVPEKITISVSGVPIEDRESLHSHLDQMLKTLTFAPANGN